MGNWLDVSLDVDNRAKIYALLRDKKMDSGEQPRAKGIHGIIPHDCLLKRFNYNNLSFAKWDWVFGPLIEFIFKSDLAHWICLGHFEGDSALWLYYFSEQLSPLYKEIQLECMPAFRKAYKCFAYNSWSKITQPPIILLSTLMQKIMAANIDNEKYPQGASLFLSFTTDSLIDENIPYLWTIDFIEEAQKVKEQENIGKIDREKILNELCPDDYIKTRLENFYSGNLEEICKRNIFFYSKNDFNSIRSKIEKNAKKYEQQLYNIFSDDVSSLSSNKFSPELWEYYSNIRKFDIKNDIDARLSRYVVWLHDSVETLNGVLCIPAWFPSGVENSESASLIVCFKNPVSSDNLRSIISAFRLGSCSVAIRSERKESMKIGEEKGETNQKRIFVHEAKGLIANILNDDNFEKLSNWGQASTWHMGNLINVWGNIPLNAEISIEDGIIFKWKKSLTNEELMDKLISLGIEHAILRADMKPSEKDLVGEKVRDLINSIANSEHFINEIKSIIGFKLEVEQNLIIPDWIKDKKIFIVMFHHCFWQAVYHALRAYCENKNKQKYLIINFSKFHCSIKNRIEESESAGMKDKNFRIKDIDFFDLLNAKAEHLFEIEKPKVFNGYFEIMIKYKHYEGTK